MFRWWRSECSLTGRIKGGEGKAETHLRTPSLCFPAVYDMIGYLVRYTNTSHPEHGNAYSER